MLSTPRNLSPLALPSPLAPDHSARDDRGDPAAAFHWDTTSLAGARAEPKSSQNLVGDRLEENALVPECVEIEGFSDSAPRTCVSDVADRDLGEIRVARDGAHRGELVVGDARSRSRAPVRGSQSLQVSWIGMAPATSPSR